MTANDLKFEIEDIKEVAQAVTGLKKETRRDLLILMEGFRLGVEAATRTA